MQEITRLGTGRDSTPDPSTGLSRLPRRISCADPNRWIAEFGHEAEHVRPAARWLLRACGLPVAEAQPLLTAMGILYANALEHTASGLPSGAVRISLTQEPFSFRLAVTDNGPRPGEPLTFPTLAENPGPGTGRGLRRLSDLALYWEWDGCAGGPITVWGVFDRHFPPAR
ncbi:ATP-binding protein [Nocardiopsis sp. YSL2]|uniref:ATP-binding protein n=1 Tax=Nocardiopsis sp. YSL2 TaxID=2939492 RepID=UPI0026F43C45|nr:ATP-binding protein [Nocardiopsis sp. YSL2]